MNGATALPVAAGLRAPRQERSEASLRAMLKAGQALINASGSLAGFSLADLTQAASTSVGAFYTRFRDKETFCALVLDMTLAELRAGLDAQLATDPIWREGPAKAICARIVGFYVQTFRTHTGLFAAYLRHASIGDPLWHPIREANQHILDLMVPCLARHVRSEHAPWRDDEIRTAIRIVVSALTSVVLDVPHGLDLDDPGLAPRLTAMLDRYLTGGGGPAGEPGTVS